MRAVLPDQARRRAAEHEWRPNPSSLLTGGRLPPAPTASKLDPRYLKRTGLSAAAVTGPAAAAASAPLTIRSAATALSAGEVMMP